MTIALARTCEGCGAELPADARRDRRFCSSTCRTIAYRRRRRTAEPVLVEPEVEPEGALERALREERLVARVAAADPGWRASAWLLERLYPEHWAARGRGTANAPAPSSDDFAEVDELYAARQRRAGRR